MKYLGLDLSKKSFHAVIMDEDGETLHSKKYQNTPQELLHVLAKCKDKPKVVLEATLNWMWVVKELKKLKVPVVLAHPARTKAIASARIKTDELDATTLAHLLRTNLIPESYIPTQKEQENRELARVRCQLVKKQTWIKNQIHAILTKENLTPPSGLFTSKGQSWLNKQELPTSRIIILNEFYTLLDNVRERIKTIEVVIAKRCQGDRKVKILKSIPGVGQVTAFMLSAEIGDISRFESGSKLASYFGLVPSLYQSGQIKKLGRITKTGNPRVRWLLVQAAHSKVRYDAQTKLYYVSQSNRIGKKKAIVAVARKIVVLAWRLLTDDRMYQKVAPRRK